MRSLEETRPCPGLSVPVATVLDAEGGLIEADQRALVRWVVQEGWGADVVFAAGTNGEWDRIDNPTRQRVIQVCAEEVAKCNAALGPSLSRPVECWAGITSPDRREVLENLEFSIAHGADAAVLAPLSIPGLDDPVRFVARDVADLLDGLRRRIPLYLYDNADIAADPNVPHLRTRQVKALSRLDFVRGIKVTAKRKVLGNYMLAARDFGERGAFGLYMGNAHLIFHIFRPREGLLGPVSASYQRWRLRGGLPVGVVAGPANVLPREWARAWQVCRAGDVERMDAVEEVLDTWRDATRRTGAGIACMKRALLGLGVVSSDWVAPGTRALEGRDADSFDASFEAVRQLARRRIGEPWVSEPPA